MHLRAQIACYELKGDLIPVLLKELFHESFENFEIYKDLYGKPCKHDWMAKIVFLIQMVLTFGGLCNGYFRDIGRFIMTSLFTFLLIGIQVNP